MTNTKNLVSSEKKGAKNNKTEFSRRKKELRITNKNNLFGRPRKGVQSTQKLWELCETAGSRILRIFSVAHRKE
jgi:hypothetical protein